MKLIPFATLVGTVYVNPDAVLDVRPQIKSDDPRVRAVIVLQAGSVSVTEEQDVVVRRLTE